MALLIAFTILGSALTPSAFPARARIENESTSIGLNSWSWPPFIIIPLLLTVTMYGVGVFNMWRRKSHAGLKAGPVMCFAAGWFSLLLALDSPIHELGEQLFSAHMI